MKGFGTFDTTNTLYGSFYSRQQDPVTNIPKFSKPDMEEQYYFKTLEMQKGYFNRYAHLYEDPTGKPIYNPIDSKGKRYNPPRYRRRSDTARRHPRNCSPSYRGP